MTHFERLLIVVGERNAGKSTALRSMFVDPRLGSNGVVPPKTQSRIPLITLSRERCLFMRLTSPHEAREDIDEFVEKLNVSGEQAAKKRFRRFNVACAMQPHAANSMPDLVTICGDLLTRLSPERIRVVQIDPRQDRQSSGCLNQNEIEHVRRLGIEVMTINGVHPKHKYPNGFLLADFFDFT